MASHTPIAELFRSPSSPRPTHLHQSTSSPPLSFSRASHRTSVSIQPHDDPFSPRLVYTPELERQEEEDWSRISMESTGRVELGLEVPRREVRRSPSFLKSLWNNRRISRSSSISSFQSLKNKISHPILRTDQPPPRVGPLHPRASLVPLEEATNTFNFHAAKTDREEEEEENGEGTRNGRLSPLSAATSYPSGTQSLRVKPTTIRPSILEPPSDQTQPNPLRRHSRTIHKSASFNDGMGMIPPTDSQKALAILGESTVMGRNGKPVERLTGFRSSVYETEQELGIAITTDAPTRYVVPDNRISLASVSTDAPSSLTTSTNTDRSTLYSTTTGGFNRALPSTPEHQGGGPWSADTSPSIDHHPSSSERAHGVPNKLEGFVLNSSSPLASPPSCPLPPLPESPRERRLSTIRFSRQSVDSTATATLPKSTASGFFSRLRPQSTESLNPLRRFRSKEALQPVSSSSLPKPPPPPPPKGPTKTVACLYLVAGLNKDPKTWSFASVDPTIPQPDHSLNAVPRYYRPEVLSCSTKVVKLSFDRDVEIIASSTQPTSTTSFFSFPITSSPARQQTLFSVSLTVWSNADEARSGAIREMLGRGAKARSAALKKAEKAARVGRRLGRKLREEMERGTGENRNWEETEGETEGNVTESEWEAHIASSAPLADLPPSTSFWLPYTLVLVSTSPLYSLLSDVLRLSWARYHQDIALHSQQMLRLLNTPLPRVGEELKIPVNVSHSEVSASFVAVVPGDLDWSTHNFPTWPLFKALHADNLLSIAELALAPLGRILFISRHAIMLSVATSTLQHVLERRGWNGIAHSISHVRDLRIHLEDPGPWIVGVPSASRTIALTDLAPEVVVVDLDSNVVTCGNPSPSAVTTGTARDKVRKRLEGAIGNVGSYFSVPLSIVEAFPNGRFTPLSEVEIDGGLIGAERLGPDPSWQWNEDLALSELDSILSEMPKSGTFSRIVGGKKARKVVELDRNTARVQEIVRKHANNFVDRRDFLETKLSKLDQKLAHLMTESSEWRDNFEVFKAYSERLSKESLALKTRLEKERREARRLTGLVEQERARHYELETSLEATEVAREQALAELASAESIRHDLEQQRAIILNEMQALLDIDDESNPLVQAVLHSVESLSNSSRPNSAQSLRQTSRSHSRRPSLPLDVVSEEAEEEQDEGDQEILLQAMKKGVSETFAAISSRLSIALENTQRLEATREDLQRLRTTSFDFTLTNTPPSPHDERTIPHTPPPRPSPSPSPEVGPFEPRRLSLTPSIGFHPKPLTLTPPVSPELNENSPPYPFVTPRTQHRRTVSKQHSISHSRQHNSIDSTVERSEGERSATSDGTIVQTSPLHSRQSSLNRSQASSMTHNRSYSDLSDYDDARSFVSISEGGGPEYRWEDYQSPSPFRPESSSFDLEELAWTTTDQQRNDLHSPSPSPSLSHSRRPTHSRQDSFGLDAPPVELFTRSGSLRGSRNNVGSIRSTGGSIDLNSRMKPSQVKVNKGRWEPATVSASTSQDT
ncbi:hypothetical protein JCM5353_003234 [Sporobolomyces roseus]